ncbi:MAG: hypothetical protein A2W86_13540 [Bacteroidetes bacterium GWD2_45_23]|nr:MAG: hypothetical protein A2W86_13540 [Bacteroidetes bacterium GWD2_45_23]HCC18209.1 hypothetical protein [Porphyromonadaceae bacterium]
MYAALCSILDYFFFVYYVACQRVKIFDPSVTATTRIQLFRRNNKKAAAYFFLCRSSEKIVYICMDVLLIPTAFKFKTR